MFFIEDFFRRLLTFICNKKTIVLHKSFLIRNLVLQLTKVLYKFEFFVKKISGDKFDKELLEKFSYGHMKSLKYGKKLCVGLFYN